MFHEINHLAIEVAPFVGNLHIKSTIAPVDNPSLQKEILVSALGQQVLGAQTPGGSPAVP